MRRIIFEIALLTSTVPNKYVPFLKEVNLEAQISLWPEGSKLRGMKVVENKLHKLRMAS